MRVMPNYPHDPLHQNQKSLHREKCNTKITGMSITEGRLSYMDLIIHFEK